MAKYKIYKENRKWHHSAAMFITPSFHVGEITRSHRKIVDIHVESIIVIF